LRRPVRRPRREERPADAAPTPPAANEDQD
jgi:hypothetical protein